MTSSQHTSTKPEMIPIVSQDHDLQISTLPKNKLEYRESSQGQDLSYNTEYAQLPTIWMRVAHAPRYPTNPILYLCPPQLSPTPGQVNLLARDFIKNENRRTEQRTPRKVTHLSISACWSSYMRWQQNQKGCALTDTYLVGHVYPTHEHSSRQFYSFFHDKMLCFT